MRYTTCIKARAAATIYIHDCTTFSKNRINQKRPPNHQNLTSKQAKMTPVSNEINNNMNMSAIALTLQLKRDTSSLHQNPPLSIRPKSPPVDKGIHGPSKTKKSVTFAPKSRCLNIRSHRDMSRAEKEMVWMTPQETKAIDAEVIKTVRAARRGRLPSSFDEKVSIRGLENIICPIAGQQKRARQANRINAVLNAQEEAWANGIDLANLKLLKAISKKYSKEDVDKAIMQAASDEAYCRGMRRLEAKAA